MSAASAAPSLSHASPASLGRGRTAHTATHVTAAHEAANFATLRMSSARHPPSPLPPRLHPSMPALQQPDEIDAICSPLSSERSPREGQQPNERLLALLTRPRADGGYGGRLTYAEFTTLAASLGWNTEDMDDCWYDIVMGEPCAAAVDMARVAECVCSYCLASPLPILERVSARATADAAATPPAPPRPSLDRNTTVDLSPFTPPHAAPTTPHSARSATPAQKASRPTARRTRHATAAAFPRYAADTASSEQRRTSLAVAQPPPPPPAPASSAAGSHAPGRAVFHRLYETGMAQHCRRAETRPADGDAEECTFQPHITPYTPSTGDAWGTRYNKSTRSYVAKLTGGDQAADTALRAPETPRVAYHPAPGPSSDVPAGYVEGVARLRRYIASRHANADFASTLRGTACDHEVARLIDAPILRLPVTVDGVTDVVDVRLASHRCRSPAPIARRAATPTRRGDIALSRDGHRVARSSTPLRTVRYKIHAVYD